MHALKRTALALSCIATFATGALAAQDDSAALLFGGSVFRAGDEVRVAGTDIEDVFAAGGTIRIESAVRENVHAAGREIRIAGMVGDDVYAAGYSIDIAAPVSGDVTAAGYRVEIGTGGSVGDDVHLAGRLVHIRGPVTGDAMLAGETVEIAAPVAGSVRIRADEIRFGPNARIDGTLEYWSDDPVAIPANVIPADRVTVHEVEDDDGAPPGIGAFIVGGLAFLLLLLILAALFAFLAPVSLARTREALAARPWRTLFLGVVATSALFGAILVLGASLIGIPLVPLIIICIPFALFAGYLTTAHAIGSLILRRRSLAATGLGALGAMALGILVLVLVGLIPLLGWVIAVTAVVLGLGTWFALLLAPRNLEGGAAA